MRKELVEQDQWTDWDYERRHHGYSVYRKSFSNGTRYYTKDRMAAITLVDILNGVDRRTMMRSILLDELKKVMTDAR